jgi:hypothetical protein
MNTISPTRSMTPLEEYQRDFAQVLAEAAKLGSYSEPIAFDPSYLGYFLEHAGVPSELQPLGETLLRSWVNRKHRGMKFGLRHFRLGEQSFVQVSTQLNEGQTPHLFQYFITDRCHYRKLYEVAYRMYRGSVPLVHLRSLIRTRLLRFAETRLTIFRPKTSSASVNSVADRSVV